MLLVSCWKEVKLWVAGNRRHTHIDPHTLRQLHPGIKTTSTQTRIKTTYMHIRTPTNTNTQTVHVHKACMLRLLSQFDASCLKCCACNSILLNDFVYFNHGFFFYLVVLYGQRQWIWIRLTLMGTSEQTVQLDLSPPLLRVVLAAGFKVLRNFSGVCKERLQTDVISYTQLHHSASYVCVRTHSLFPSSS